MQPRHKQPRVREVYVDRFAEAMQSTFETEKSAAVVIDNQPPISAVYKTYKPLIDNEVNRWSASGLPRISLDAEAKRIVAHAVSTHQPSKGTLGLHLKNNLRKLDEFVNTYAPQIRVPTDRVHLGNKVFQAREALRSELGREPSVDELITRTGVQRDTIGTMHKQFTQLYSVNADGGFSQPVKEDLNHDRIAIDFVHHTLTPVQKVVLEHTTGYNNRPILSTGDIAKRLKVSDARVSALKKDIAAKITSYNGAIESLMS